MHMVGHHERMLTKCFFFRFSISIDRLSINIDYRFSKSFESGYAIHVSRSIMGRGTRIWYYFSEIRNLSIVMIDFSIDYRFSKVSNLDMPHMFLGQLWVGKHESDIILAKIDHYL